MSSDDSTLVRILTGLGRTVRELGRAQEDLWARLDRIDPAPGEALHWEPGISGWRLHGSYLPEPPDPGSSSPST
ncbi:MULTISPECIES: hypothetical protein [Pseudonocardia]|uniref:Uncharacterized protein n=2 Tax=Pseudonocardia TaxID=1847 RepID=A0A1Y2N7P6_PSEAH|nr:MULTISPECIES: hypothetical protein [Pseudonocardia]OSY43209.1 hypothetical protein BG845_00814 [Pseudonocardia autotrophica]TDN71697.1 hypothetical protein C8E95_0731 [Pseudonocardia autotrophica]BBG02384.1 hypothetical protein Pdca_35930 [Pseudonocardia autotrophica]GEC23280.1 hypothetical protein PSA01_03090 [Pseudonocardia saturnea]